MPCPEWNAKLQHCFEYPTDGVALTPLHSTTGDPIIWRPIPVFQLLVTTWLFEQDPQTGNILYHVFAFLLFDVPGQKRGEPISNILKNCVQVGLAEVPFEQRHSPSSFCIAEFHYDGEYGESLPFAVNAPGGWATGILHLRTGRDGPFSVLGGTFSSPNRCFGSKSC